jgi:hypothetical protein
MTNFIVLPGLFVNFTHYFRISNVIFKKESLLNFKAYVSVILSIVLNRSSIFQEKWVQTIGGISATPKFTNAASSTCWNCCQLAKHSAKNGYIVLKSTVFF